MAKQPRLNLDKAERTWLASLKETVPDYAPLEIEVIAHIELKNRLMLRCKELKTSASTSQLLGYHRYLDSAITISGRNFREGERRILAH